MVVHCHYLYVVCNDIHTSLVNPFDTLINCRWPKCSQISQSQCAFVDRRPAPLVHKGKRAAELTKLQINTTSNGNYLAFTFNHNNSPQLWTVLSLLPIWIYTVAKEQCWPKMDVQSPCQMYDLALFIVTVQPKCSVRYCEQCWVRWVNNATISLLMSKHQNYCCDRAWLHLAPAVRSCTTINVTAASITESHYSSYLNCL